MPLHTRASAGAIHSDPQPVARQLDAPRPRPDPLHPAAERADHENRLLRAGFARPTGRLGQRRVNLDVCLARHSYV